MGRLIENSVVGLVAMMSYAFLVCSGQRVDEPDAD